MLSARPVLAAATIRSVWRLRKAGICSTSTASAACGALADLVHVGQHRQADDLADLGEDRQRLAEAEAPAGARRGAVGLVEGGLVDEADVQPPGDLLERSCGLQRVGAAFELAGPGDDRQPLGVADAHRPPAGGWTSTTGLGDMEGKGP